MRCIIVGTEPTVWSKQQKIVPWWRCFYISIWCIQCWFGVESHQLTKKSVVSSDLTHVHWSGICERMFPKRDVVPDSSRLVPIFSIGSGMRNAASAAVACWLREDMNYSGTPIMEITEKQKKKESYESTTLTNNESIMNSHRFYVISDSLTPSAVCGGGSYYNDNQSRSIDTFEKLVLVLQ